MSFNYKTSIIFQVIKQMMSITKYVRLKQREEGEITLKTILLIVSISSTCFGQLFAQIQER